MSSEHAVILVDSTSHALRIEKLFKEQALECRLIPVPRHLSSDCGVCVRILAPEIEGIKALLMQHHVEYQSIEVL
ncbi:MAG: DUF3343 domain-containing protein [Anaerolineales bacterium]|nr:DUF3343 domain-containing protein [Anaerolineales bacterium]